MHLSSKPDFEPSNAARWGRRRTEDIMFKFTRGDLAQKTTSQLAALFNQTSQQLGGLADPSPELASAKALLAMIRDEQSARRP